MSAFVLNETGFNTLACELASHMNGNDYDSLKYPVMRFLDVEFNASFDEIESAARRKVEQLQFANVAAVNARYTEDTKPDPQKWSVKSTYSRWNKVQLMKNLQCLRYQMDEGDIPETQIYKELSDLIGEIATHIVSRSAEYDTASWGW